jgi:hypothetical protein
MSISIDIDIDRGMDVGLGWSWALILIPTKVANLYIGHQSVQMGINIVANSMSNPISDEDPFTPRRNFLLFWI